jgi:hypothetical protein
VVRDTHIVAVAENTEVDGQQCVKDELWELLPPAYLSFRSYDFHGQKFTPKILNLRANIRRCYRCALR